MVDDPTRREIVYLADWVMTVAADSTAPRAAAERVKAALLAESAREVPAGLPTLDSIAEALERHGFRSVVTAAQCDYVLSLVTSAVAAGPSDIERAILRDYQIEGDADAYEAVQRIHAAVAAVAGERDKALARVRDLERAFQDACSERDGELAAKDVEIERLTRQCAEWEKERDEREADYQRCVRTKYERAEKAEARVAELEARPATFDPLTDAELRAAIRAWHQGVEPFTVDALAMARALTAARLVAKRPGPAAAVPCTRELTSFEMSLLKEARETWDDPEDNCHAAVFYRALRRLAGISDEHLDAADDIPEPPTPAELTAERDAARARVTDLETQLSRELAISVETQNQLSAERKRVEELEAERDERAAFAAAETEHANKWSVRAHEAEQRAKELEAELKGARELAHQRGKAAQCDFARAQEAEAAVTDTKARFERLLREIAVQDCDKVQSPFSGNWYVNTEKYGSRVQMVVMKWTSLAETAEPAAEPITPYLERAAGLEPTTASQEALAARVERCELRIASLWTQVNAIKDGGEP